MNKIVCIGFLAIGCISNVQAQGLFNKVKNKLANAVEAPVQNNVTAPVTNVVNNSTANFTNPAKYGKIIKTYTKKEKEDIMGGESGGAFDLYFISANVVGNELELKIGEYYTKMYSYSNGVLQQIGGTPTDNDRNKFNNGSEYQLFSTDFSQIDNSNAMTKQGAHIQSGMVPGKTMQDFTFKGKKFASFYTAALSHNADSSVIALLGTSFANGKVSYCVATSGGLNYTLPAMGMSGPLVSPDGKVCAVVSPVATGTEVHTTQGHNFKIGGYRNNQIWLRNTGSVFYVENTNSNSNAIDKDGVLYASVDAPIDIKKLFISKDDKRMCWMGKEGLYFSDGSIFKDVECPFKTVINNEEVIVFMAVDIPTGNLYLCKHNL